MHGLTVGWSLGDAAEGVYVLESAQAREQLQQRFEATAADSPGRRIIGSAPVLVEPCAIVGVAEGAASFLAAPSYR